MAHLIDARKFHEDDTPEDRPDWPGAHIVVFLLWAVEQGLAADTHTSERATLFEDPHEYLGVRMASKLHSSDLTEEGVAFADAYYTEYLEILGERTADYDLAPYEYASTESGAAHLRACLDEMLEEHREE